MENTQANATTTAATQIMEGDFDILAFEECEHVDVVVRDPQTGAPTAFVITLAGPMHPLRKRDAFNRARKMRNEMMKTGKVQLDDPEEEDAEVTERLVDYTLGAPNGVPMGGKVVPYSPAVMRQLYNDPKRRWLRDFVKAAIDERERFIKRSVPA